MQLLINNQDGRGPVPYTDCLYADSLTIVRKLNAPTACVFVLFIDAEGPVVPQRFAPVAVVQEDGTVLFSGVVALAPARRTLGVSTRGATSAWLVQASSSELVLDLNLSPVQLLLLASSGAQAWTALAGLPVENAPALQLAAQVNSSGRLQVPAGSSWSEAVGAFADATLAAYSMQQSGLQVVNIGENVHALPADVGGLVFKQVSESGLAWVANDVTICGKEEPAAYVTEIFVGDGTTTEFVLSEAHFSPVASQRASMADLFQSTTLNPAMWRVVDPAGLIALTSDGLTCGGGSGADAEATVSSVQQVELGGVTTIEASGVLITGGLGLMVGLFSASPTTTNCIAAFAVQSTAGGVVLCAELNGATVGSAVSLQAQHTYVLRLRVYCQDVERVRQTYFYLTSSGSSSMGGEVVVSGGRIELEIQDTTSGMPGSPVVLYSGSIAELPAAAYLGLIDSGSLTCSIKSVTCVQSAPFWVATMATNGSLTPQPIASAANGGTCEVSDDGSIEFYSNAVPMQGQLISVSYRTKQRAVARRNNAATGEIAETWIGSVTTPMPWTSVDCENAALAVLAIAAGSTAAVAGAYTAPIYEPGMDVWPGDVLAIGPMPEGETLSAVVREVAFALHDGVLMRTAGFSNAWVDQISIKLSSTVPEGVAIPQEATAVTAALPSLTGLTVTQVNGASFTVSLGVDPPVNGGFEVRRRDNSFGPGVDSDLVSRGLTETLTIPRLAPVEQYYFRMYDGATPPNYSMFSAAVFLNVPM